jgi:UDP-glucose 4-epimerase
MLIGGTGFIGRNLATRLRQRSHDVTVTGLKRCATSSGNDKILQVPIADVERLTQCVTERRIDTVVHLVSSLLPSSNENEYFEELGAVVAPTFKLAQRLSRLGVRLVFVSSGGTVYGVTQAQAVSEDQPCHPINFYGLSKTEIECQLLFLRRTQGLGLLIVRPSNPYGPGQSLFGNQGLVSVILGRLARKEPLPIWGDGSAIRDYIYIDDCVESLALLIENDVEGTTLNLGSGVGHSLLDVVAVIENATGKRVQLDFLPARPVDVPRLVLDVSRLRSMGMHRTRALIAGVRSYLEILGDNP